KNAPIRVLDEATSALDTDSERLVEDALESLMIDRRSVVIACLLSTVRRAARIIVLVDGGGGEDGTHDELLGRNGEYSRLCTLRSLEERDGEEHGILQ